MSKGCPPECGSKCCRYITVEIESPVKNKTNRDEMRWYLFHENIHLLREDGSWYLQIDTRCGQLGDDGLCKTYEDRPKVCREYETKGCDYHGGPNDKQKLISTAEQWEAYLAQRKRKKAEKKRKRKAKKRDKKKRR